jgi:hypothetical protein
VKCRALTAAAGALAAALAIASAALASTTTVRSPLDAATLNQASLQRAGPAFASGRQVWSGYVDVAHANVKLRYVASNFTVPAVRCTSATSKASFWVGLDGYGTNTVEQVGISTDCYLNIAGVPIPFYQSWWEMFPGGTQYVNNVRPGDQITASVYYNYGTGVYSLAVNDKTSSGGSFTVQKRCPSGHTCQNTTAEAILEANNGTALSNFTPVTFFNSAVTSRNGTHGAFGNANLWNLAEPVMTGSNGQPLANVSPLSNHGGNFRITYHESH